MNSALHDLLESYREAARSQRDKGTYFETLRIAFLASDPVQVEQYEEVKSYSDWAIEQSLDGRDIGIDLVSKLRGEDGYAAIQCKFYDADYPLELFQRVITVSLETMKIVRGLPRLDID